MTKDRRTLPDNVMPFPGVDPESILADLLGFGTMSGFDPFPGRSAPEPMSPPADPVRFTVRVDLDDAKPPIWRRLELAGDLTLAELHDVLQAAMGWTDSHLHQFFMGPDGRNDRQLPFVGPYAESEGDEGIPERDVRLDQLVAKPGHRLFYEYDFGDGWEHTIKVESVSMADDEVPRARCLTGKRACPPEDVGGIPGYFEVLDALADPASADEWMREKLDWLPEGFDPAAFDLAETDELVQAAGSGAAGNLPFALPMLDLLAPGLREVVARLDADGDSYVGGCLDAGALDDVRLDDETAFAVTATLRMFLDAVGDGVKLTGAGWLPPAMVLELIGRLPLARPVWGRGNREQNVPPVAALREAATALGLVRKNKGQLLVTAVGAKLASNPAAMLQHLVGRLPVGRTDAEKHAGWLALMGGAAGVEVSYDLVARALTGIGWRIGDDRTAVTEWQARDLAKSTRSVLSLAGWNPGRYAALEHDERARVLAQLAVRG